MVEQDTIRLLRECDAGVKMGISAIEDVIDHIESEDFSNILYESKQKHQELDREIQELLNKYHDDGKDPSPMAKGMSKVKTDMKIAMDNSDKTIADLITDGCNMGVKSLHKYLNKYKAADEKSKKITKKLTNLEEKLAIDIRSYL
ncbi:MAG: hypothetical protein J1F17_04350 [Oscillospiraceae bacterium]|nr:hypothetical protein [Oscillospiraceae bacterium]